MLLMFKVKNYTSFKDESILDLRAATYVQHASHYIKISDKVNLLKTNAIYGANASGKSNFISAMFFFKRYIKSQIRRNKDTEEAEYERVELEPFLLSESKNEASEFDVIFLINGRQIQYGFECTATEVFNEWYYIDDKMVFERKGDNVLFGPKYRKTLGKYNKKIPKEGLYIAILDFLIDDMTKAEVLGDFWHFMTKEFNVFLEIYFEATIKGVTGNFGYARRLAEDEEYRNRVAKYLQLVDIGIKGIDIQEEITVNRKTGKETKRKVVKTVHNVYDDSGKVVGEEYFDLKQESTGTYRFFSYIQSIITMIENGGVFIVDEFSSRLHPKLSKLLVDIFQSETNNKAQLIFTTHDISLLNNNQFRRDEVIFIDKNERGESRLYALSDLKVREDSTFSKDYMQGKYGAIPVLDYDKLLGSGI